MIFVLHLCSRFNTQDHHRSSRVNEMSLIAWLSVDCFPLKEESMRSASRVSLGDEISQWGLAGWWDEPMGFQWVIRWANEVSVDDEISQWGCMCSSFIFRWERKTTDLVICKNVWVTLFCLSTHKSCPLSDLIACRLLDEWKCVWMDKLDEVLRFVCVCVLGCVCVLCVSVTLLDRHLHSLSRGCLSPNNCPKPRGVDGEPQTHSKKSTHTHRGLKSNRNHSGLFQTIWSTFCVSDKKMK